VAPSSGCAASSQEIEELEAGRVVAAQLLGVGGDVAGAIDELEGILDCNPIGFGVSSRPDGRITTFFTGSLIPNPTNPHLGQCFLKVW